MSKIQSVRGTKDIYSSTMRNYNYIINEARFVSELFGYEEASFPVFERAEVFSRPLGISSDVVSKETYTFEDRGGDNDDDCDDDVDDEGNNDKEQKQQANEIHAEGTCTNIILTLSPCK